MKEKLPGSLWINGGWWNWRVTIPGEKGRKNFKVVKPGTGQPLPGNRPKGEAVSAAWAMWRKMSMDSALDNMPSILTVDGLCAAFCVAAHIYYRGRDGEETGEASNVEWGLMPYRRYLGAKPIDSISHSNLVAVRKELVAYGYSRTSVNKIVGFWKRMMAWALDEGMVSATVKAELTQLSTLKPFRSEAKETRPVCAATRNAVKAVCKILPQNLADMIRVQELTGMRPGEVAEMKWQDVEIRDDVWLFRPESHKNEHRGLPRVVVIGPIAQRILSKYKGSNDQYIFSPKRAMSERYVAMREARLTKVQPSQIDRSIPGAQRRPGDKWETTSYAHAVRLACNQLIESGVIRPDEDWSPNMLRHSAGTRVRKWFGGEAARAVLGHASGTARITDRYSWEAAETEFIRIASPAMLRLG